MLDDLYKWQQLLGAIVGGVFALLVALIVARDARSRTERAAAMTVIAALLRMRASHRGARDAIVKKANDGDDIAFGLAAMFSIYPAVPSEHFSQSSAVLLHVHTHVAAHLSIIETVLSDVRHALNRWVRDQEDYSRRGGHIEKAEEKELPRSKGDMLIDAKTIERGIETIEQHANCVVPLLEMLVLSNFRTFQRLRLWFAPNEVAKVCAEALRSGEFPSNAPRDDGR